MSLVKYRKFLCCSLYILFPFFSSIYSCTLMIFKNEMIVVEFSSIIFFLMYPLYPVLVDLNITCCNKIICYLCSTLRQYLLIWTETQLSISLEILHLDVITCKIQLLGITHWMPTYMLTKTQCTYRQQEIFKFYSTIKPLKLKYL